jgi:IS5 family transposase
MAWEEERTGELLEELQDVTDDTVGFWREELGKVRRGQGGVASFTDPDCRWGYRRRDDPYLGYKAHASCDESGIVTSVQVLGVNASESQHLPEVLVRDQAKGVPARSVVADKAYDSQSNRRAIREAWMEPEIPARYRHKQAYRFDYQPKRDSFWCSAGKETVGKCQPPRTL